MDEYMKSYSDIEPEFNRRYDKEFNQILALLIKMSSKFQSNHGAINQIKNGIIPYLKKNC